MLPMLSRYLICPLHERLLGRRTFRYLRELQWSQWAAPAEIRALQERKLTALLAHAREHTAFYRGRFIAAGIDTFAGRPFEALNALPLLTKDEIRESIDEMVWPAAPGGLFAHHTGGSTGDPLKFYFGRRRQAYDQAARIRTHRWFGVDVGDRELYLWGSPIETSRTDRVKRWRDALYNHKLLNAFEMSPERMEVYLDSLERFNPACLFGYPSSIALLVEYARAQRRRLKTKALQAVFVTGEVCHPHVRETIADYFRVPVADGYGSREAGFIAHECPEGSLHVTAENVIVEFIDDGRPVDPGEPGEIVITHLDAYAMPMIRYRTGDMGRFKPGRCTCGRGLPMIQPVEGRSTDFLYLPDGTIKHALSVIYPLREIPGLRRFRVEQREDFGLSVAVVPDDQTASLTCELVEERLRRVVGAEVAIEVAFVHEIPAEGSGKYRHVVSRARPPVRKIEEERVGV